MGPCCGWIADSGKDIKSLITFEWKKGFLGKGWLTR